MTKFKISRTYQQAKLALVEFIYDKPFWGLNGRVNWWGLRSVGSIPALKVSYLVLFLVPVTARYDAVTEALGLYNWVMIASFFSSLCLAVANLIYDIFCPVIVKRFASPNDMYFEMLKIKEKSASLYPQDKFDACLEHCQKSYFHFSESSGRAGKICAILFLSSAFLFAVIVLERLFQVLWAVIT
ncbi:hypothetical protein ACJ5NV_13965 [Loktanella agnita]|uniref:hypothetical protein n=1 Tax=Loktanella agnita TaxID=287097 RepID=UPI003986F791